MTFCPLESALFFTLGGSDSEGGTWDFKSRLYRACFKSYDH